MGEGSRRPTPTDRCGVRGGLVVTDAAVAQLVGARTPHDLTLCGNHAFPKRTYQGSCYFVRDYGLGMVTYDDAHPYSD